MVYFLSELHSSEQMTQIGHTMYEPTPVKIPLLYRSVKSSWQKAGSINFVLVFLHPGIAKKINPEPRIHAVTVEMGFCFGMNSFNLHYTMFLSLVSQAPLMQKARRDLACETKCSLYKI